MAPVLSKLRERLTSKSIVGASSVGIIIWVIYLNRSSKKKRAQDVQYVIGETKSKEREKSAQVDMVFFRRVSNILKILVPGLFTPESAFMTMVAIMLVARSYCDIWMINNGTQIESSIIGRDFQLFTKHLKDFVYAMPLISLMNNLLKFGLNELQLRFRQRLTVHLYNLYMREFIFYKMSNLDNRISNADQLLTTDVEKFCNSVTDLYSNILKPSLDIGIYVQRLTASIGAQAPAIMIAYLIMSGLFLTNLRRPYGRMTVTEQKLEGEFRYVNARIITNSEEVAFYQGNHRERITLHIAFKRLVDHLRNMIKFKFSSGFVDNIVAKYVATLVGYFIVSYPFFSDKHFLSRAAYSTRLQDYYKNGRMLVKLAEAIGRLVLAGREMTRLAGFTARVTELMKVLKDLNEGHYERTMVADGKSSTSTPGELCMPLIPGAGQIIQQDNLIKFERVPLITPNGDVLVRELNFEVCSGMNVLVCGPNGCGKSSLFRILGELWPLFGGVLTKPPKGKLFYIPQRPYMTLGTLRDQVIYPHTKDEMLRKGCTDTDLLHFLEIVQLKYILDREEGWDAVADWMDVLSGGEKQRIAMARLFYHRPQFAILDECTSAVSVDVEGSMYQYCKEVGITLFTVSHRKSLWTHHEYYLHMDGRGSFEFKPIEAGTEEFGS